MPLDSTFDPRDALVKTKYFNQYPQPLERWLWKQALPQAAERVFWLHWTEGRRNGDWCSEIPLKRVALECCVDPSTVTRSYQLLKSLDLLRREDPGRDPKNPFCQATAITEVRLPRAFITELGRSPNRPQKDSSPTTPAVALSAPQIPPSAATIPAEPAPQAAGSSVIEPSAPANPPGPRQSRQQTQALWARASDHERTRFFVASKDRLTHLEFDPDTRLTPEDRGWILAQLAQLAVAKPSEPAPTSGAPKPRKPVYQGPRRLSVLDLARTRKRIFDCVPGATAGEILRQVIWAVEEGALRRFEVPLALNIAVKKIRDGAWSRPHRMPPQWMPRAETREHAAPVQCSAA
jgi:hypothetical protein